VFSLLAGEKFSRSLMTSPPVSGSLYLLQRGFPADRSSMIDRGTIWPEGPRRPRRLQGMRDAQVRVSDGRRGRGDACQGKRQSSLVDCVCSGDEATACYVPPPLRRGFLTYGSRWIQPACSRA
jgi:hypothetical protein